MTRYALLFLMAMPVAATQPGTALPVPSEWHTVYVVFMEPAENPPALSDDALHLLNMLHLQHQLRLQSEGHAFASGEFGDDGRGRGMAILCAETGQAARVHAESDPMVQFGQRRVTIQPWQVPVSAISCKR